MGSQEISGVTGKFDPGLKNETGQKLTEFCQEKIMVIANVILQQHRWWPYTWASPEGQYWNQTDFIFEAKSEDVLYSQE